MDKLNNKIACSSADGSIGIIDWREKKIISKLTGHTKFFIFIFIFYLYILFIYFIYIFYLYILFIYFIFYFIFIFIF